MISSKAEYAGDMPINGFTLHDKAIIRHGESKGATRLRVRVAGNFDVQTTFTAPWGIGTIVADQWDTTTTDLLMASQDAGRPLPATLEVFARDMGDIVYSDTPCRGFMQDLILEDGANTNVKLVDTYRNHGTAQCAETLYLRNVTIAAGVLEVDSFVIYYTGSLSVTGTVKRNGIVVPANELDTVFIQTSQPTRFGDMNGDGDITGKDVVAFCDAYNNPVLCPGLADGNCDRVVDDADKALMEANYGATIVCP